MGEDPGAAEEGGVGQAETFKKTLETNELKNMPRVFAYIIRTVGPGYRLNGSVPWVSHGRVFFGPCKGGGLPRRILLWMTVAERLTFKQAYERGRTDKVFRAIRGKAIHVRPRKNGVYSPGVPEFYERSRSG